MDQNGQFDLIEFVKANIKPLAVAAVAFILVGQFSPAQWGIIPLAAGVVAFFAAKFLIFKQ